MLSYIASMTFFLRCDNDCLVIWRSNNGVNSIGAILREQSGRFWVTAVPLLPSSCGGEMKETCSQPCAVDTGLYISSSPLFSLKYLPHHSVLKVIVVSYIGSANNINTRLGVLEWSLKTNTCWVHCFQSSLLHWKVQSWVYTQYRDIKDVSLKKQTHTDRSKQRKKSFA